METPLISIVIPVYKIKEEYLRNCIDCLIDQGRTDYRIILIDDGSPDNCGSICDEYAEKYDIITTLHQENQGAAVARNTGIDQVNTKWLTFVDGDDWVDRDYMDTIFSYVTGAAADADMIMFNYVREYSDFASEEAITAPTGYLSKNLLDSCKMSGFFHYIEDGKRIPYESIVLWNKVYKLDFLKRYHIRFVPEAKKGQDRLFNTEALTCVSEIFYLNKAMYHYRCIESSRTNRYDPEIPELITIELKGIESVLERYNLDNTAKEYFYCSVSTRIYSCMRLCYFHPSNPAPYKERVEELEKLVGSEPYQVALKNVNMGLLNTEEKIFVYCIKLKMYWVCSLLVKLRSGNTRKKLG